MRLENKIVFVCGGASEMAVQIEKLFLQEGAKLVLVDISREGLDRAMKDLGDPAEDVVKTFVADAVNLGQMEAAAAFAVEAFGWIDIMLNCAGIIRHCPIDEMTEEIWQSVINVNLTGAFHACKVVVPYMKKQNYGRILNISSLGGRTARGVGVNYSASKAGIVGMTMTLSGELAPWNITVNSIAPGPMRGRMFDTMEPERIRQLESGIPLGRVGTMQDVAYGALYLCSDEASWVTGEVLDINGGIYCKG